MGDGAGPSDYAIVKYLVEQGHGWDIAYIVEQTGIRYSDVVRLLKRMRAPTA